MSDNHLSAPGATRGALAWMASNSVAANLLMFVLVVGGVLGLVRTKQEVFPEFSLDQVSVRVVYPGASPAEVEQGILLAIEERVRGLDGVKRVQSTALEGSGTVSVELLLDAQPEQVLADVKNEVDRVTTFPEEAEAPTVSLAKRRRQVVSLILSGDQDIRTLHNIAEGVRQGLLGLEDVTQVELEGVPRLEVAIEVTREVLRRYGLTLGQIAQEVSLASVELPAGGIDTEAGELLVRVADRRTAGHELHDLVLRGTAGGAEVRLGEIATIRDGYEDTDQYALYNGKPAVRLTAYRVGDETPTAVAAAVRGYAKEMRPQLPPNISIDVWNDDSRILRERIDLLLRNALMGLGLVLLVLALFLDLRLAFWVSLGIPISFLGSFLVLGPSGMSVNMITLFAFIVTLGMVVDDAIVVGERTYALMDEGKKPLAAAIEAARTMAVPITFAILTTVAAFAPLFFVPGTMGKIFKMIPAVVISVLLISLVESFLILPAHLGHGRRRRIPRRGILGIPGVVQRLVARSLDQFIQRAYKPAAILVIRGRYIAVGLAVAVFVLTAGIVGSGRVPFNFFPSIEGDVVTVQAQLPYGSAIERTERVRSKLAAALNSTIERFGEDAVVGVYTRVGESSAGSGPGAAPGETGSHLVALEVALHPSDERDFEAARFAEAWRETVGELRGVQSVRYSAVTGPGAGAAVAVQLVHTDIEVLGRASERLRAGLAARPSLTNVQSEYASGKPQLDFHLRPVARSLGLSARDVAGQLRAAFYGVEAVREQRGRNEIRIVARLEKNQRRSEHDLTQLMIHTPKGGHVPLGYVADFDRRRAATAIRREDGRRSTTVSAALAEGVASPRPTIEDVQAHLFPELLEAFPGLELGLVGQQREQQEAFSALKFGYLFAMFAIFALLAVPFQSYLQPAIIMAVIPFGVVGAIAGHAIMGYSLSVMSIFGVVALSGVVVNDSLVLIDASNRERRMGATPMAAILAGGVKRFRPILLTSLTTFFGLMPMISETSTQARFLIPMAISVAFGVLAATVVVLLIVPALYMIIEDVRLGVGTVGRWLMPPEEDMEEDPKQDTEQGGQAASATASRPVFLPGSAPQGEASP
ncbi:MAG: efflux RND transporter permease subunit [Nannocystaceae bacterium]